MYEPFEVTTPTGPETPVVVEVPHAATGMPAPYLEPLAAPARSLARDADLYVDTLYADAHAEGATMLVAKTSRYAIDVNRAETDVDAEVVEGARSDVLLHHGLVWRTTSDGAPALTRRLSRQELEERLDRIWRPYHHTLADLIEDKRRRFGVCVVLAAHSMPSAERAGGNGNGPSSPRATPTGGRPRADVVPGTRGRRSAAPRFIEAVESLASAHAWTLRHDDPYAGGYTTQHYGRPAEGVHVVQVELARRLYLDETTLRPSANFEAVRRWCRALVAELGRRASQRP
jgi:N-formylglutamate amidohydrolase